MMADVQITLSAKTLLEAKSAARLVEKQATSIVVTLGALVVDELRGELWARDLDGLSAHIKTLQADVARLSEMIGRVPGRR